MFKCSNPFSQSSKGEFGDDKQQIDELPQILSCFIDSNEYIDKREVIERCVFT
jgi:hypothetical protein